MQKTNQKEALPAIVALKKIVEGTSSYTGEAFYRSLVKNLAETLQAHGVWITEYLRESNRLRALAFWLDDHFVEEYEYDVPGTPCEPVLENESICHVPENVIKLYPKDPDLPLLGAVSYMGLALRNEKGTVLGHLALLDNKPMQELPEAFAIFRIFAARAAAEMQRMAYEKMHLQNEAKLNRLFNGTHEILIEFNQQLMVTQANQAALANFGTLKQMTDLHLNHFFDSGSLRKIEAAMAQLSLASKVQASIAIDGRLACIHQEGHHFPVAASIARYKHDNQYFYALFLKNLTEEMKANETINRLHAETSMLREQVYTHHFDHIIGESPAIMEALKAVKQVAPTDSTVLIRGETGTGKELFARAIHDSSRRNNKPYITLNCAALPSELVESELFGHVKGAFTGAMTDRVGRFALADGGTLFLDEVGELPLALQAKLLRVIQEGEFEHVGSSKTTKVDVRVIAATNRNMEKEIRNGTFREDLYYRLNVFPIEVPPLRERGKDILLLAEAFLNKFAKRHSLQLHPIDDLHEILLAYHWPGNIRELQNIMERAVITSHDGFININNLFPDVHPRTQDEQPDTGRILTEKEMLELEKQNILKALKASNWQVSGSKGAAALLQLPPTTLSSRIKKLGIKLSG